MHKPLLILLMLLPITFFGQSSNAIIRATDIQPEKNTETDSRTLLLLQSANADYAKKDLQKGKATLLEAFNYCSNKKYLDGELKSFIAIATHVAADESLYTELLTTQNKIITSNKSPTARREIRVIQDSAMKVLLNAAIQLYFDNKIQSVEKFCLQLIEFRKVCDPSDIRPYDMMSLYSVYSGNLNKALLYGLKAASIQEKKANAILSERPYDNVGKAYSELGNNELALQYFYKAISILRKKDTVVYATLLKNITQVFLRMGKPEQALSVLNENIASRRFDDPFDKETIKDIYGNCYLALGQYDAAEKEFLERYSETARLNSKVALLIASAPLAKLYMIKSDYKKASFFLDQLASDTNRSLVPISVQRDVQNMLYQSDSANGNYASALSHLKLHKVLNDSIFNTTKNKQIEELKVQYETAKKDQNIQLLTKQSLLQATTLRQEQLHYQLENEQKKQQFELLAYQAEKKNKDIKLQEQHIQLLIKQDELKNAALQKTLFTRNVSLVGAVLLILLLVLLYSRYRIKQKNNIELQTQKDIIRQKNKELQLLNDQQHKLLAEKEWLMKEIHHRVKNNMQIIISLLNAQAEFLENPSALSAILESRERMQAMALIHQRLYLSNENTLINMRSYVKEMVSYLHSSFANPGNISFQVAVEDIELDIAQVVPLGLMINEAITNAVKYAFPDGKSGTVRIVLQRMQNEHLLMKITDNGKGFHHNSPIEASTSFGIQLMRLFAEQLEGKLSFETEKGVSISLLFKEQQNIDNISYSLTTQQQDGENINR